VPHGLEAGSAVVLPQLDLVFGGPALHLATQAVSFIQDQQFVLSYAGRRDGRRFLKSHARIVCQQMPGRHCQDELLTEERERFQVRVIRGHGYQCCVQPA
jgi:hypothetical protein